MGIVKTRDGYASAHTRSTLIVLCSWVTVVAHVAGQRSEHATKEFVARVFCALIVVVACWQENGDANAIARTEFLTVTRIAIGATGTDGFSNVHALIVNAQRYLTRLNGTVKVLCARRATVHWCVDASKHRVTYVVCARITVIAVQRQVARVADAVSSTEVTDCADIGVVTRCFVQGDFNASVLTIAFNVNAHIG